MRTIYFDTETTGLNRLGDDEVVELAVLDDDGAPLLSTLVRPVKKTRWDEAQAIHGIGPDDVRDAPTMASLAATLQALFEGAHLIIYNAAYDLGFLSPALKKAPAKVSCCMQLFAEHYGAFNEYHQSYTWQPLSRAAAFVHHTWQGAAHRALADTIACRAVWHYLTDEREAERVMKLREAAAHG